MILDLTDAELKILRLITKWRLSCGALAKELKVSRATAAKRISDLRKKGIGISTMRDNDGWFYLLQPQPDPNLSDLVGIAGFGGRDYSISVDEEMLEHLSGRSKKKQALIR